ncbi:unnamed protein product [Microthlaspi erraticum]|uniref:Uncharacterized protein n=1 Tax=Microthlaspi erraticum TaxID=1685480 RepID=A0A6D2IEM7_9BRAS|nr:unnamed protein product [Microthlaspi erraticum]
MKEQNQSVTSSCGIHPIEFIEGVCPLCLNERLLVLASIQKLQHSSPPPSYHTIRKPKFSFQKSSKKKNSSLFSFLGSFDLRHHKFDQQTNSTSSPEDSFISIEFEDNDGAKESSQLENCKASRDHQYHQHMTKKKESVPQPSPSPRLTWRKRIGRLLRVTSFRRRSSAKVKGDDSLMNRNWLRPSFSTNRKTQN